MRLPAANCETRELITRERWTTDATGTASLAARSDVASTAAQGTVAGAWLDALCAQ